MKFSIILPVYNVDKYLSACIDSILSQTFSDYEIILVDDGSTDSCPQICDEYAEKNKCVKVIHKENGGLSDARNVGLKVAQGDYVFFIDSDDYLIDNTVLQLINEKLDNEPDIVCFGSIKWFESTGKLSVSNEIGIIDTNDRSSNEVLFDLIDKNRFATSAWSKVIKRSLLINNHIEFEKGLLGEDNDWYYKVVCHLTTIKIINKPLYVYRQRTGSITKTYTYKNLEHLLWIIEKWEKFVNDGLMTGNKQVIRNDLARQYCNAIIGYSSLVHTKEYYPRLKSINYLLQFSNNQRVKTFRLMNRFLGLKGVILLLKMRMKILS